MRGQKHSDETRGAALAALLAGQSVSAVARQCGIPESTVRDIKKVIPTKQRERVEMHRRENVVQMVANLLNTTPKRPVSQSRHSKRQELNWHGTPYLYIVQCSDTNYYKIGVSKIKPHLRLGQMQTGNPYPLRMISVFETDDAAILERHIHKQWGACRGIGEWFQFSDSQLQMVKRQMLECCEDV